MWIRHCDSCGAGIRGLKFKARLKREVEGGISEGTYFCRVDICDVCWKRFVEFVRIQVKHGE